MLRPERWLIGIAGLLLLGGAAWRTCYDLHPSHRTSGRNSIYYVSPAGGA